MSVLQSWHAFLFLSFNKNALKLLKPSQNKPFQLPEIPNPIIFLSGYEMFLVFA